jgi:hypothetical protein
VDSLPLPGFGELADHANLKLFHGIFEVNLAQDSIIAVSLDRFRDSHYYSRTFEAHVPALDLGPKGTSGSPNDHLCSTRTDTAKRPEH